MVNPLTSDVLVDIDLGMMLTGYDMSIVMSRGYLTALESWRDVGLVVAHRAGASSRPGWPRTSEQFNKVGVSKLKAQVQTWRRCDVSALMLEAIEAAELVWSVSGDPRKNQWPQIHKTLVEHLEFAVGGRSHASQPPILFSQRQTVAGLTFTQNGWRRTLAVRSPEGAQCEP